MEAEEKALLESYKEELEVSELTLEMLINSHRRQRRLQEERSKACSKAYSMMYGRDTEAQCAVLLGVSIAELRKMSVIEMYDTFFNKGAI